MYSFVTKVIIAMPARIKRESTEARATPPTQNIKIVLLFLFIKISFVVKTMSEIWVVMDEARVGFPDLWSGQKPWWNWYLTPAVIFCEVRRAQLAKSTLLTSKWCPCDLFRSFNPLAATCRSVRLPVIRWKMLRTSHSIFFIFQVVKLLLC